VQPDKAIDVIDEAGARVRLKQHDQAADLAELEDEIAKLTRRRTSGRQARTSSGPPSSATRPNRSARRRTRSRRMARQEAQAKVDGVVDKEVIAETVSKMTGIPLTRLEKDEAERLLKLEEELHKRVVSQDEAVHAIAKAVRRSRSGLKDPKRPMGSFIFLGPSGVGKTLLAKALARVHVRRRGRDDPDRHVRVHGEAQRLAWSARLPATSATRRAASSPRSVRRRPYSVVLLDEIEKAHPTCSTCCSRSWRRAPDRLVRPARRLPQRHPDHDLQHRRRPDQEQSTLGFRKTSMRSPTRR
jgi:ATP-dependent Clp protease ATP-binding subunit ClpC